MGVEGRVSDWFITGVGGGGVGGEKGREADVTDH